MTKVSMTFTGEIKEVDGFHKLEIANRAYYLTRLQKAPLGKYRITIEDQKSKRSPNQNSFYWGVYLPLIAEETGEDDTEALHSLFKELFLPKEYATVMGKEVLLDKSTTKLSKGDFSEFIKKIERHTGILAPNPCESGYFCGKCPICIGKTITDIPYPEEEVDIKKQQF